MAKRGRNRNESRHVNGQRNRHTKSMEQARNRHRSSRIHSNKKGIGPGKEHDWSRHCPCMITGTVKGTVAGTEKVRRTSN